MAVLALGVSFRRAPIDLLERLAFTEGDLVKAYQHARELDGIDEAVVLSTCNRVEVYGSVPSYHAGFLALKRLLTETRGVAEEHLADGLYAHWERDAVEHLFSVAGGLDSMVLGETQIQSQVREALRLADGESLAGTQLKGLFHAATRAGRRIRQETSLGAAPDAFVERGASLAEAALGTLADRSVVVIGAGTMASLAVKHLRQRGVGPVRVLNRSLPHARALAERTTPITATWTHSRWCSGTRTSWSRRPARRGRWYTRTWSARHERPRRRRSSCSTWPCRATWSPRPVRSPA